jgi:hypothetical protein
MAEAFLLCELMDETSSYLQRGRQFSGDHVDTLGTRWVVALANAEDEQVSRLIADLEAEFRLREMKPPVEAAQPQMVQALRRARLKNAEEPLFQERVNAFEWRLKNPNG